MKGENCSSLKKCRNPVDFPHYKLMLITLRGQDLPFVILRMSHDIYFGKLVRCDNLHLCKCIICELYFQQMSFMIAKSSLNWWDFGNKQCHQICKRVLSWPRPFHPFYSLQGQSVKPDWKDDIPKLMRMAFFDTMNF